MGRFLVVAAPLLSSPSHGQRGEYNKAGLSYGHWAFMTCSEALGTSFSRYSSEGCEKFLVGVLVQVWKLLKKQEFRIRRYFFICSQATNGPRGSNIGTNFFREIVDHIVHPIFQVFEENSWAWVILSLSLLYHFISKWRAYVASWSPVFVYWCPLKSFFIVSAFTNISNCVTRK